MGFMNASVFSVAGMGVRRFLFCQIREGIELPKMRGDTISIAYFVLRNVLYDHPTTRLSDCPTNLTIKNIHSRPVAATI